MFPRRPWYEGSGKLLPPGSVLCHSSPVCSRHCFNGSLNIGFWVEAARVCNSVFARQLLLCSPELHVLPANHAVDFSPPSSHVSPKRPDTLESVAGPSFDVVSMEMQSCQPECTGLPGCPLLPRSPVQAEHLTYVLRLEGVSGSQDALVGWPCFGCIEGCIADQCCAC